MLIDAKQRLLATDPEGSFIVQAPAGSGKTEILTQRYLRLLGRVQAPEQIIALTFTRKAASEMRERILHALQFAASGKPAESEHQQRRLDFANQALEQNNRLDWQLLEQPNRMRIITIDSLCQTISQAIPLQEKQIAFARITDTPQIQYLEAARSCLRFAMENADYQKSLQKLLLHLDNREDRLLSLFSALLANRDQWLGPLYLAKSQDKETCEAALFAIEQHTLSRFHQSIPPVLAATLIQLAKRMASLENNPASARYILQNYSIFASLDAQGAQALAALVLTGEKKLRAGFDHHIGLKKGLCPDSEYYDLKSQGKALLTALGDYPDFLDTLLQASNLPEPEYDLEQWEVLHALFQLLPLLTGFLHLGFSEQNIVDFATVSQQALFALGDAETPTDLALYLDNSIHHLLIDEFQDTSITQFQLLTQLVQGWQPGDAKTLFVVGDPMQSIYRFRQAEVGLFLKAQEQGIGAIPLISLELQCNFRSSQSLVHWVNEHFKSVFPAKDDIESGAVTFHPSTAVKDAGLETALYAWEFSDKQQEAQAILALVKEKLATCPEENIAILVRSRSQLSAIIALLREEAIPYQGVDITLLAKLPHLRDVWSLTRALLMPANRLAWLELLRSPCCGLSLADLHILANIDKKHSIYKAMQTQLLSEEGQIRANFVFSVLHHALAHRQQTGLSQWVGQTLKALHGDYMLSESEQQDLEQFWNLLDRFEEDGQLPDLAAFENELLKLYSQQVLASPLKIMTIHKSKGLEFDTVILPGLGTSKKSRDAPLLRWLNLPGKTGDTLLISPVKAAHQEKCALYDYIGDLEGEKDAYELQRLLYVAVTRAKKSLYLLSNSAITSKNSFRGLLKHQIFDLQSMETFEKKAESALPDLFKLPLHFYNTPYVTPVKLLNKVSLQGISDIPRITGIISHAVLQWICDNHPRSPEEIPENLIGQPLKYCSLSLQDKQQIREEIHRQIRQLFKSEKGQWIIQAHSDEQNEYALLVEVMGKVVTRIIDRTFCTQGERWVIDFKTGKDDEQAAIRHRKQVEEYAAYVADNSGMPVRCGLYYLANDRWLSWIPGE